MFIKMLHAPCKSPLSRELFTAWPCSHRFPPSLSFQSSALFSARSGQINLCCMPYLPSFSKEIHIVNVKPEDSGLSEENRDGGFYTWMKVSGSKKPPCEISQLPHSKCPRVYLLSAKRSRISSLLLQITVAFLIIYKCIQDPLCSSYPLTSVIHQIICQKMSYPNSPLGILMMPLIWNEMFTVQSETEIELKLLKHPML